MGWIQIILNWFENKFYPFFNIHSVINLQETLLIANKPNIP